jgi:hypothetical protein
MLKRRLDEAATSDQATESRIIAELAARLHETLSEIVDMRGQVGKRLSLLMRILRAIGYPANRSAIPWLIASTYPNGGAWQDTVLTIGDLSPQVVVPYLVQRLLGGNPYNTNRAHALEDICPLLYELDPAYAAGCGPTIAHLLAINAYAEDPSMLLEVLEKVGPPCAIYAAPALLELLRREVSDEVRADALRLIATFENTALAPYQLILASLSGAAIEQRR